GEGDLRYGLVAGHVHDGYLFRAAHGGQVHALAVRRAEGVVGPAAGVDPLDDLGPGQVHHLVIAVPGGDVDEFADRGHRQLVGGRADLHSLGDLVVPGVDPHQFPGILALDRDVDHVLGGRHGDAVRVRADHDAADGLVRRHVNNRHVVAGAVGDVQLLPD